MDIIDEVENRSPMNNKHTFKYKFNSSLDKYSQKTRFLEQKIVFWFQKSCFLAIIKPYKHQIEYIPAKYHNICIFHK